MGSPVLGLGSKQGTDLAANQFNHVLVHRYFHDEFVMPTPCRLVIIPPLDLLRCEVSISPKNFVSAQAASVSLGDLFQWDRVLSEASSLPCEPKDGPNVTLGCWAASF